MSKARVLVTLSLSSMLLLAASHAAAQTPDADKPATPSTSDAPDPRVGWQLALRTGVALPMGSAVGGATSTDMNKFVPFQVPIVLDLGGKVIPHLFVGGYFGLGFGGGGDAYGCGQGSTTCASLSIRGGALVQYHFLPDRKINPWLGYGIGFESTGVGVKANGSSDTNTFALAGWDFAHLMAGADFRLSRVFGVGPFADFSIGQYSKSSTKIAGNDTTADVQNTAMHEWLTLGVRGTFFP